MQNNKDIKVNSFFVGMNKDIDPQFLNKEGQYTHAINSQLNSHQGNKFSISNEPSNYKCADFTLGTTLIGDIAISDRKHVLFFTDDNDYHEIGIYNEDTCSYEILVTAPCLDFSSHNLISGQHKGGFDCSDVIYWADGRNPRRYMNIKDIPRTFTTRIENGCAVRTYSKNLDCDRILAQRLVQYPCIDIELGTGGALSNGSYQVAIAYTENQQRVTDFLAVTVPQQIFSHNNKGGSLRLTLDNLDTNFEEYELAIIYTVNQQTSYESVGFYPSNTRSIYISRVGQGTPLSAQDILKTTPDFYKADGMAASNGYALWFGITTRTELNYQLQAFKIKPRWVAYKVPYDYYRKGGNKVGYYRDEVYSFGIQWLYNTGHWSPAFHIPGPRKAASDGETVVGDDVYEATLKGCDPTEKKEKWQIYNTAGGSSNVDTDTPCKEYIVGTGNMGFWQSTETYPNVPEVFGDFACQPIRHPKMPDSSKTHIHGTYTGDNGIVILGAQFDNIERPKDKDGKFIYDIVGYRIVRADRAGNRTVIARGMLFNTGEYKDPTSPDANPRRMLYANYPYNDLRIDPYLSITQTDGGPKEKNYQGMGSFRNDIYTFHSPHTQFRNFKLTATDLVIETEQSGVVDGYWEKVYKHPKNKVIRDSALFLSMIIGLGEGTMSIVGKRDYTWSTTKSNQGVLVAAAGSPTMSGTYTGAQGTAVVPGASPFIASQLAAVNGGKAIEVLNRFGLSAVSSTLHLDRKLYNNGISNGTISNYQGDTPINHLPPGLALATAIPIFAYYFTQGTKTALEVIRSLIGYFDYAYQFNSHCFYNQYRSIKPGAKRRAIIDSQYLQPVVQNFGEYTVNNYKRESSVIIRLDKDLPRPRSKEKSRVTISGAKAQENKTFQGNASSYYATMKVKRPEQYGQLDSIVYQGTGHCVPLLPNETKFTSPVIFGGDCYINRYTEKRKMHYFNQTAYAEKDGFEFDYRKYYNIPYPRFWLDSTEYDLNEFISIPVKLPNDKHNFDNKQKFKKTLNSPFVIKDQYFYLYNNGVIDFYVESDFNLDYRDWNDIPQERHYDPYGYTDLSQLFRSDIVDFDNYFKYDGSLEKKLDEVAAFPQRRSYTPSLASECYTYYPNRVIYSLPSSKEDKRDNWLVYLSNNKYDFPMEDGTITAVVPLERSSVMFLMSDSSPYLHRTIDELQTEAGVKVTIGDGGLFSRAPQKLMYTDYAFGSSQSRWAVNKTHFGTFFVSQRQGRIFSYQGGQLEELSRNGLYWHLKQYLPSRLLQQFPDFKDKDNPAIGIGLLSVFDNTDERYYLCKRDFQVKSEYLSTVTYDIDKNQFYVEGIDTRKRKIKFKDPRYFEECSWTLSYSPGDKAWDSFHDWHPEWLIQTENHFSSVKKDAVWKHNERCDSFCNFYEDQYPFEVEYVENTQTTSILNSIEYYLEAYEYSNDCRDSYHLLDYNFSDFLIYNSEQTSGQTRLFLKGKTMKDTGKDPNIEQGSTFVDTQFSKEENKYRISQFRDMTRNRGEFGGSVAPLILVNPDGYHRSVNNDFVNYEKSPYERKKMRHLWNKIVFTRRDLPHQMKKMILKLVFNKTTRSYR